MEVVRDQGANLVTLSCATASILFLRPHTLAGKYRQHFSDLCEKNMWASAELCPVSA